jgi:hypothetical protein
LRRHVRTELFQGYENLTCICARRGAVAENFGQFQAKRVK